MNTENKQVYSISEIQKLLGLGRTKTYNFLDEVYKKQEPFRVIKIGKLYRIPNRFPNMKPDKIILVMESASASFIPILYRTRTVIRFAKPSFAPGIPKLIGIKSST